MPIRIEIHSKGQKIFSTFKIKMIPIYMEKDEFGIHNSSIHVKMNGGNWNKKEEEEEEGVSGERGR